jgi:hypothetical protein
LRGYYHKRSTGMPITLSMSAFGGKAGNLRECPLMTQSGHERLRIAAMQTDPETHSAGRKSLL